jgi:hypothetical protein
MKWFIGLTCLALAAGWGAVCLLLIPDEQPTYRGLTAAQWEGELFRWTVLGERWDGWEGRQVFWTRTSDRRESLLQHVGLLPAPQKDRT